MQDTLNIDTLNAHCGSGPVSGPRLSEGRRKHQSRVENRSPGFSPLPSLSGDWGEGGARRSRLGPTRSPDGGNLLSRWDSAARSEDFRRHSSREGGASFWAPFSVPGLFKKPPFFVLERETWLDRATTRALFLPLLSGSGSGLWNFSSKKGHGEVSCGFGLGLRLWKGSR